ncbi:MAG: DUF177 domain-containing protein [Gammaproteobacteria bacterium]|nr:DUF177 domain-containing protein [Gammaproteobacteria bacterium]
MSTPPERPLDAVGLARSGTQVERDFPVAHFARLLDRLAEPSGQVQAIAAFRQAGEWPAVRLAVTAVVVLTCQRCLGPVRRTLASEAELVFADEGAQGLPEGSETVSGDPHRLDLAALVEDELLLALPIIPQHDAGEACALPAGEGDNLDTAEMRRPFAGLKDLLKH